MSFPSAFLPSPPDPASRQPFTIAAFLPLYSLLYVLAVLSILPHTFILKLALLPILLWQDWKCAVGLDLSAGLANLLGIESSARLRYFNFLFVVRFCTREYSPFPPCTRRRLPVQTLQKLIAAINEEYPILEYLILVSPEQGNAILKLPETLQAPHLRHLLLFGFTLPVGSRLLTTAVGLVTICLIIVHPSSYFHPNTLLRWISFMPQLEALVIVFTFPVLNRDVERQLMRTPITVHVTLPNLFMMGFRGASAYMEAVFRHINPPRLEKLEINLLNQLTFFTPHLLQFMNTTENLRFIHTRFLFSSKRVGVEVYPHEGAKAYALSIDVDCWHLDWQVSSVAQMFNALSQKFTAVEHLTIEHEVHSRSSEEHNEVDRAEWRKLLRSFSNAKTLSVGDRLVRELSCCLQLDDGEHSLEILPELQKLIFSGIEDFEGAFTQFIDARQNAGRPVTLTRHPSLNTLA